MSEMVERVARAIYNVGRSGDELWTDRNAPPGSIAAIGLAEAVAAIEAMRDPTREMLMASGVYGGGTTRGKWKAMIEEALKESAGTTQKSA